VEAQQCVQLTGTNRSFDLIALICQCASWSARQGGRASRAPAVPERGRRPAASQSQFCFISTTATGTENRKRTIRLFRAL
jgi:hypothetical protein